MAITASMVKELRELTGAGMLDCKNALTETNGDVEAAVALLKEKGIAKAAKKAGRIAAEGLTKIIVEGNEAVIAEINSETDFVAKNEQFINLIQEIASALLKNKPADMDAAMKMDMGGKDLETYLAEATSTIGEKITLRRFEILTKNDSEVFGAYSHNGGKIGAVVELEGGNEQVAKEIAMHISAMKPTVISYKDLDPKFIEEEVTALRARIEIQNEDNLRTGKPQLTLPDYASQLQLTDEVMAQVTKKLEEELAAEGKPEKIWANIIPGKLAKFVQDNTQVDRQYCLLSQTFIMDDKKTVAEYLEGVNATVKAFVCYEVGEGIEKKEDNFAEEVMAQVNAQ